MTDPVAALDLTEAIVRQFETPISITGKDVLVRPSIGVAVAGAGGEDTEAGELIRNADAAMYICKRDGKGGYRVFESVMHERALERLELRNELRRAVESGQFEVYHQPVVSLPDGRVTGMEALVRWHHPTRGLVQPGQFIPLAEEMGLIVDLGRWVLQESCRHAAALHASGEVAPDFVVGVNLSVKQLQHPDVIADVRAALRDSGLEPEMLVLEITETVMMADYDTASRRLHELKELGIHIAMDDFGTGYSSLSYLSRLPVDILKMDRSFLAANASPEASGLAAAIIALGKTLGVQVLAEGIESSAQYDALRALGCDYGQGFFIARRWSSPRRANGSPQRLPRAPRRPRSYAVTLNATSPALIVGAGIETPPRFSRIHPAATALDSSAPAWSSQTVTETAPPSLVSTM